MEGIIDIHCHILPGVDDGPPTEEAAIEMLEEAEKAGISEIVATPHLIWEGRMLSKEEIEGIILRLPSSIPLHPGAETPLLEADRLLEEGNLVDWQGAVLLDTPPIGGLLGLEQLVFKLRLRALLPIIAHPERNPTLSKDEGRMEKLKSMGAMFQINASALIGEEGKERRKIVERLLEKKLVDFLSSDAHDKGAFRALKEARDWLKKKWGEEYARALTFQNALSILKRRIGKVGQEHR